MITIDTLQDAISAIGALGTASFALVDASKWWPLSNRQGGASYSGFHFIEGAVQQFLPVAKLSPHAGRTGVLSDLLDILHGNWINGMPLADQKAIAKSMLKLRLSPETAAQFAEATNVDSLVLQQVAAGMVAGTSLAPAQSNVLGRFDLALTALLDASYQRADQCYRNSCRVYAMFASIALALIGGWASWNFSFAYFERGEWLKLLLCGLFATPLAPISKDLTSALAAAVKLGQSVAPRK